MAILTPEQVRGTKFEIWAEELFKDQGYWGVHRNVVYHRSRYAYRQVDVECNDFNLFNTLIVVELKYTTGYSAGEPLRLRLRSEKQKTGQLVERIDTILNELEERRLFVDARTAILATNGEFDREVWRESSNYPCLELYDRRKVEELDASRRGLFSRVKTIEQQVATIDLSHYSLPPRRKIVEE